MTATNLNTEEFLDKYMLIDYFKMFQSGLQEVRVKYGVIIY